MIQNLKLNWQQTVLFAVVAVCLTFAVYKGIVSKDAFLALFTWLLRSPIEPAKPQDPPSTGPTAPVVAAVAGLTLLPLLGACVGTFEEARLVQSQRPVAAAASADHRAVCRAISDRQTWWLAAGAVTAACAGGGGVTALTDIVGDDGRKVLLGVAVTCTVLGAGAVVLSDQAGKAYVIEGCAQ